MAKYAVGYVLALLILALAGLIALDGRLLGTRPPWVNVGGGVDIGRPLPVPAPPPDAFPREVAPPGVFPGEPQAFPGEIGPPDMIVTDANGSAFLPPLSYCWSSGNTSVCADGFAPTPGTEPGFVASDHPVELNWQIVWNITLQIDPDVPACPGSTIDHSAISSLSLDMIETMGSHLVWIYASSDRGDASWVIRVDNQVGREGC